MFQFIGSLLDGLLFLGFGALLFFQPKWLVKKDGTPEQVQKRVRLARGSGALLSLAGIGLLIIKLSRL